MSISFINTGSHPNSGDGDTLRTAFNKINANFGTLYNGAINLLTQSDRPPTPASTTTLWYDTVTGRTYVYYDNGWVDSNPAFEGADTAFLTSSTIGHYIGFIDSVSLYDSLSGTYTNTVNNVKHLNFDTESAFSVTDQGSGAVLIGMNSTFKYIDIANQPGLTAIGLDTLTFVAGKGIVLTTDPTVGHQSITITSSITPTTSTAGFLYDDGAGHYNWVNPTYTTLNAGTSTFTLNANGSIRFNNGTIQTTAYIPPAATNTSTLKNIVFVSNSGTLGSTSSVTVDSSIGKVILKSLQFEGDFVQTIAYTGTIAYNNITDVPSFATIESLTTTNISLLINDVNYLNTISLTTTNISLLINDVNYLNTISLTTTNISLLINDVGYITTGVFTTTNISLLINDVEYITTGVFTTTNISEFINDIGYLTSGTINNFVSASSLNNNGYIATLTSTGDFIVPSDIIIEYQNTPTISITATLHSGIITSEVANNTLKIETTDGAQSYFWIFNPDGSITWPDGSIQSSASTATSLPSTLTNHINNGTQVLQVLADGTIEFPDGTIQATAYRGSSFANSSTTSISLLNGQYELRPVAVPVTLTGSPGDKKGDVAFDGSYFYYCTESFNTATWVVHTVNTLTNALHIDILQGESPTPQQGWEIHDPIGGPLMTITNVISGLFGPTNIPYWRLSETFYPNSYYAGLPYILVDPSIPAPGWVKTPWNAVNKVANFVSTSTAVKLGNISVDWVGYNGNKLQISAISGVFTATYNLTTCYGGTVATSNGVAVSFNTTGVIVGGTSSTPGDKAEALVTILATQNAYRITAMTGATFDTNFISIEQIK